MDKNLLALLIIIPIALIGGDWYLNAKKRKMEITRLKSNLSQTEKNIAEANEAKGKIPTEQKAVKKLKRSFQIIMRILPTGDEAETLLKQTIPIADKWIQFTELSPVIRTKKKLTIPTSAGKATVEYDEVAMKMTMKATFSKLGRYFQEIENMRIMDARKLVDVSELDIKVEPSSDQLLVNMEVKAYSLPEK